MQPAMALGMPTPASPVLLSLPRLLSRPIHTHCRPPMHGRVQKCARGVGCRQQLAIGYSVQNGLVQDAGAHSLAQMQHLLLESMGPRPSTRAMSLWTHSSHPAAPPSRHSGLHLPIDSLYTPYSAVSTIAAITTPSRPSMVVSSAVVGLCGLHISSFAS